MSSSGEEESPLRPLPEVRGTGKWHVLTIIAGSILIVTFFLPLTSLTDPSSFRERPVAITSDFLRGMDITQAMSRAPEALGMAAYIIALVVLPHVWGLLMMLFSVMSLLKLRRLRRVPQAVGVVLGVPVGLAWDVGVAGYMVAFVRHPAWSTQNLVFVAILMATFVVALAAVLYALLAVRRSGWAYLYHGFAGAGASVFSFGCLHVWMSMVGGARPYIGLSGLTITSLTCCLLLFSRIGEARAITGLTWRRTQWYLLTLRLHKAPQPVGLCPGCGYNLCGLREQRCPECGRRFSFEEVLSTPQSLGFAGAGSKEET